MRGPLATVPVPQRIGCPGIRVPTGGCGGIGRCGRHRSRRDRRHGSRRDRRHGGVRRPCELCRPERGEECGHSVCVPLADRSDSPDAALPIRLADDDGSLPGEVARRQLVARNLSARAEHPHVTRRALPHPARRAQVDAEHHLGNPLGDEAEPQAHDVVVRLPRVAGHGAAARAGCARPQHPPVHELSAVVDPEPEHGSVWTDADAENDLVGNTQARELRPLSTNERLHPRSSIRRTMRS